MKRKFQKLIWAFIVVITILNLFVGTISNATNTSTPGDTIESIENEQENDTFSALGIAGSLVDGLVGLLSKVIQIPILLILTGLHGIFTVIAELDGSGSQANIKGMITPDDVLLNRIGLTDINFFDLSGNNGITQSSAVYAMRVNIATWYYILRIFAVVVLLAILIYVGIRMAISTIASEQAKYKQMLLDWAVSFALLFLLGYIIMFTLEVNSAFVSMLTGVTNKTASQQSYVFGVIGFGKGIVTQLITNVLTGGATKSWASLIVYAALVGMTLAFLFMYIKRMLTVGFLIIISPLITITYSIDKMKDGQAQALNTWLKEFMLNVLIQPFHIIIYLVFVSSTMEILATKPSISLLFLSIMCMGFVWTAEKIVKQIFGFGKASSLGDAVASMAIVRSVGNTARKAVSAGAKAGSKTPFGQNVINRVSNSRPGRAVNNAAARVRSNPIGNHAMNLSAATFKKGMPIGVGAVAAGFEMGTGSPANAVQVGVETASTVKEWMEARAGAPGSYKAVQDAENRLEQATDALSRNNTQPFEHYRTNAGEKANMRSLAESMISANMTVLNGNVQAALNRLQAASPGDYNLATAAGNNNMRRLYEMATDPNLDFSNPATHPLHRAYTAEEMDAITQIQLYNLAEAVQGTQEQYKASGSNAPEARMDRFIDGLV